MTVKPWAKAIAATPGRPAPSPMTAPAPAPMNINAKVPMNSARSLAAIRLDIADLQTRACVARIELLSGGRRHRGERPPAGEAGELLRGDHLRREMDAYRLGDAKAVFGISPVAVDDLPLDDLDRHAF